MRNHLLTSTRKHATIGNSQIPTNVIFPEHVDTPITLHNIYRTFVVLHSAPQVHYLLKISYNDYYIRKNEKKDQRALRVHTTTSLFETS
jgi:hypothetical protein